MFKLATIAAALCLATSTGIGASALAQDAQRGGSTSVVVLPFAALGAATSSPASRACVTQGPSPSAQDLSAIADAVDAGFASQLADELAGHLRVHGGLTVDAEGQVAPSDALTIAACILRADPGDPAKRLVGLGLGASVLSVHVQVYRGGQTDLVLADEFDTEVQGENKLPPIGPVGLAVHGIRGHTLTLSADADKAARLIAQRVLARQYGL